MNEVKSTRKLFKENKEIAALYLIVEGLGPQTLTAYRAIGTDLANISNATQQFKIKTLGFLLKKTSTLLLSSIVVPKEENSKLSVEIFRNKARGLVSSTDFLYCLEDFSNGLSNEIMKLQTLENSEKKPEKTAENGQENPLTTTTSDGNATDPLGQTDNVKQQLPAGSSIVKPEEEKKEEKKKIKDVFKDGGRTFKTILSKELNGTAQDSKDSQTNKFFSFAKQYFDKKIADPTSTEKVCNELLNLTTDDLVKISSLLFPVIKKIKILKTINSTATTEEFENLLGKPKGIGTAQV
jgi:hypothetical protein